jgi:hypothetical protein
VAATTEPAGPLAALEERYGGPVLVYAASVAAESMPVVYDAVRRLDRETHLHLLLGTAGGSVTAARRLAVLLREHVGRLTVLLPARAWSAGTLVCLAADELVPGPLSELGPIDAQVGGADGFAADLPAHIGAEDVRGFPEMAREWFGVQREEDALQVLALVAQRIFPTSLTAFHRADRLVRRVADELMSMRVDPPTEARRAEIVDALIRGRGAHDDAILRTDARALGLPVRMPDGEEASALWAAWSACEVARHRGDDGAYGLIGDRTHISRERRTWSDGHGAGRLDVVWGSD